MNTLTLFGGLMKEPFDSAISVAGDWYEEFRDREQESRETNDVGLVRG